MARFYFQMTKKTTSLIKNENNNYSEILLFGRKYINNTLSYDFDNGLVCAPLDNDYLLNRYSAISKETNICGVTMYPVYKFATLIEYILSYLHSNSLIDLDIENEFVFILDRSFLHYWQEYIKLDHVGVIKTIIELMNEKYKSEGCRGNIYYKGAFESLLISEGLSEYILSRYPNGFGYIDDTMVSFSNIKNKSIGTFGKYWTSDYLNMKEEIDSEFYKYLSELGIPLTNETYENVKNFIFDEARKHNDTQYIRYIIRDEEYMLDTHILKKYIHEHEKLEVKTLLDSLESLCTNSGYSIIVNISNPYIKSKAIERLLSLGAIILNEHQYIEYYFKKIKYVDCLFKYNVPIFKKRMKDLCKKNNLTANQAIRKFLYDGIYFYKLSFVLSKKEHINIYKMLGYEYLELKNKYYY